MSRKFAAIFSKRNKGLYAENSMRIDDSPYWYGKSSIRKQLSMRNFAFFSRDSQRIYDSHY